jgi:hypothetical protein
MLEVLRESRRVEALELRLIPWFFFSISLKP